MLSRYPQKRVFAAVGVVVLVGLVYWRHDFPTIAYQKLPVAQTPVEEPAEEVLIEEPIELPADAPLATPAETPPLLDDVANSTFGVSAT